MKYALYILTTARTAEFIAKTATDAETQDIANCILYSALAPTPVIICSQILLQQLCCNAVITCHWNIYITR